MVVPVSAPSGVTAASAQRRALALELVSRCPLRLGHEVATTGSTARGLADSDSDLELIFWTEGAMPAAEVASWLRHVGAERLVLDAAPVADGSRWVTFRYRGVWVEAGWQAGAAQDALLDAILAGRVVDHDRLLVAATLRDALPLRGGPWLRRWRCMLARYPDEVQAALVRSVAEGWRFPHVLHARLAVARRGERLALAERLVWDVHDVLRLLYAVNRRWEPDWKWALHLAEEDLALRPDRLGQRLAAIFTEVRGACAVHLCLQLMREALALVPPPHDVTAARGAVAEVLGYAGATARA